MHHGGIKAKADFGPGREGCIAGQGHDEVGAVGQARPDHGFSARTSGQGNAAKQVASRIIGVQVLRARLEQGFAARHDAGMADGDLNRIEGGAGHGGHVAADPVTSTLRKFIDGEPRKPATNRVSER